MRSRPDGRELPAPLADPPPEVRPPSRDRGTTRLPDAKRRAFEPDAPDFAIAPARIVVVPAAAPRPTHEGATLLRCEGPGCRHSLRVGVTSTSEVTIRAAGWRVLLVLDGGARHLLCRDCSARVPGGRS